jgi:hypothetical protein
MVNGKDVICWIFGTFFFFLAFMGITAGYELTNTDLGRVILFGLIGLSLIVSGSIFNLQQE